MTQAGRNFLLALAIFFNLNTPLADPPPVSPTPHVCNTLGVSVRSANPADTLSSCQGAGKAIAFLASQGFDVTHDIRIEVVPELTDHASASAAGCFVEPKEKVLILSYSEFEKFRDWFRIPIDRPLYRSLVAHEVAHAVAACNFKIPRPSIQAKEYIAYVAQISTMDAAQRERVLLQYPGEGFEADRQMNTTIYLFDPMRFAVKAYRHFLKPGNGRDYLAKILVGEALSD